MKSQLSRLFFIAVSSILTVFAVPTDSSSSIPQQAFNATLARETVSSASHTLLYKYYYQQANLLYTREYLSSIIEAELLLYGLLTENNRTQFSSQELADLQAEVDSFAAYQHIDKFKGMEDMITSAISKPSPTSKHLQNLFSKDHSSSSFVVAIQNEENRKSLIDAIINDDNVDRYVVISLWLRMLSQKSMSATEFLENKLHLNLTRITTLFEDSSLMWLTIIELRKKMEDPRNDQEMYSFARKIQGSANITYDFLKILQGEKKMMKALNLTEFEMIVEVLDSVQSYKGQAILSYYRQNTQLEDKRYYLEGDANGDKLRRNSSRTEQEGLEKTINRQKQQQKNQEKIEQTAEDQSYQDQQLASKLDSIVQSLSEMQNKFQDLKADQERFNGEMKNMQGSLKDLEKTFKKSNTDKLMQSQQQLGQQDQVVSTNKKERQQSEQDEPDILEDSEKLKTKKVNKDVDSKDDEDDDGGFASIKVLLYSAAATFIVAFGILACRKYQLRRLNRELAFQHDIMKEEEL